MTAKHFLPVIDGWRIEVQESRQAVRALTLPELIAMDIKPRGMVLDPILPEKALAQIYGWRGCGKTLMALSIGYAVASGGSFLRWHAPQPRRVLYIDGEMPMIELRERLIAIAVGAEREPQPDYFRLLAADYLDEGLLSLATKAGQESIAPLLADVELLIIDNVSTLTDSGLAENDAESWSAMQGWLLTLRRRGVSVLLVHHAGKGGQQRGTSRREDVLHTVIALRRPRDYRMEEGARFEVHLEKARGIYGKNVEPFEAQYRTIEGKALWTMHDLADANMARVIAGIQEGMTLREIAKFAGVSKSAAGRLKQRAKEAGLL
jgi:putative DNA primase/helicase